MVLGNDGFLEDDHKVSDRLCDDIGMDSLDRAEFMLALEEEFDLPEIDSDDEEEWVTLLDVIQYVDKRVTKRLPTAANPAN